MSERPHISASQVAQWELCRLKHFYSRQDRELQATLDKQDSGGSLAMQVAALFMRCSPFGYSFRWKSVRRRLWARCTLRESRVAV